MRELSLKEKRRKCSKCGSSPADDPTVNLHRFPQPNKANKSRCELWAKFCFPNEAWRSPKFQNKLFTEHKMLCDKHFKRSSFEKQKRLCKFSVPENDGNKDFNGREEGPTQIEIEIKHEPDQSIDIEEHSFDARSEETKSSAQESQQLKRRAEKNIENEHRKKTKDTNANIHSQEDVDDTTCDEWAGITKNNHYDDCELYGKLLTKKLKNYLVYERNILMFKIDGLLIEHPPGFDTSTHSYSTDIFPQKIEKQSTKPTSKPKSNLRKKSKKVSSTSESTMDKFSYSFNSSLQKRKVKKTEAAQNNTDLKESLVIASHIPSTSTPLKITNNIQNQSVKVTSSVLNQPVKVTSLLNLPAKLTSNIHYQPIKVTGSIPNQAVKVSSIPNKSVKVTSCITNEPVYEDSNEPVANAKSTSLPSHVPLHITIPKNKLVNATQSKVVTTSTHPKGKIVILKSKSGKYVPSSQPPILITVPTLSTVGYPGCSSSQCDMNSLEQLSSIAVDHASQTQQVYYDPEVNVLGDDTLNDVSHEVVV